ncbi:hypothetical protein ACOMHN_057351 [Nucella lapillus]
MTGLGPDSDGRSGEQGLRAGAGGHGQKSDIRQTRGSSVSPISSTPRPSGHRQREAALAAKTSLRRSGSRGSKSTDIEKKRGGGYQHSFRDVTHAFLRVCLGVYSSADHGGHGWLRLENVVAGCQGHF